MREDDSFLLNENHSFLKCFRINLGQKQISYSKIGRLFTLFKL